MNRIDFLVNHAILDGMKGMAITDHGNLLGIKELLDTCKRRNNIRERDGLDPFKPIAGCEMFVAKRGMHQKDSIKDIGGWHLIVLAKNLNGYRNLVKLVSRSWDEGYYGKPRTDHEDLEKYHKDLIVCSACLGGEIPRKILEGIETGDMEPARKAVEWYKHVWGDDFYLELQRHEVRDTNLRANRELYPLQQKVNEVLMEFSKEYGIKLICTNDCHFIYPSEAEAHDRMVCSGTGQDFNNPNRIPYFTKQEWFKSQQEMNDIFSDVPEALDNTMEILDKVEIYDIDKDPSIPSISVPSGQKGHNGNLCYISEINTKTNREYEYRKQIQESIECYNDDTLDVLCQIAEEQNCCDRIIKEFDGKLATLDNYGFSHLVKPCKVRYRFFDWCIYKIVDMGIDRKNVKAGAFLLVLKKNDNDDTYDFEALYDEIKGWAKREFGIDLIFCVVRDSTEEYNRFYFVAGLSVDINDYKNKNELWHKE